VHSTAGRFDEAYAEAHRAARLRPVPRDPWTGSNAPNELGIIANCTNKYAEGEAYLLKAIDAFHADSNRPGEASALCNLSRVVASMGRTSDAVELANRGIAIYDELGLTLRLANAGYALGIVLTQSGRYTEALQQFAEALRVFVEGRQRLWEGATHFRIAQAHLLAERPAKAAEHAEQALATGIIGGEWMQANALTLLGKALRALGQLDRARACWQEALTIHERVGRPEAAEVRGLLSPVKVL
jgi:tetratricopeptide (TPR) repeat protein